MTALLIVLAAIVLLFTGYVFYGSWLAKQWGIDPTKKTPAIEKEDGVDYVAAKPAVLMGHHFSSIAGAGPINGPIQASIFGWVPVFLWCIIGGIFFGGLQDFGSLFASIRHDGKSVGEIIEDSMGSRAKKLFIIFALLVLILVIASFVNIVAGTFLTVADEAGKTAFGFVTNPTGNQSTAMISLLFIVLAVIYGYVTNRMGVKTLPATIGGIIGIVLITVLGLNVGFAMNRIAWIVFVGVYIAVASLVPVWILLQPRDYLSSFLLYAMIGLAFIGVVAGAFTGTVAFDIPAFTSWEPKAGQTLFPMLFITVACGACSGFHSLIATGTSSKQLANEKDAKGARKVLAHPLFGTVSMVLIGCILGGLSLSQIWGLFGAANQLLAGIALMAVAAWLGEVGKNNKMFYFPMVFMLAATLTSLVITVINKCKAIGAGTAAWGDWFQLFFATAMAVLAIFLVVEGAQTFAKQMKEKKAKKAA